MASLYGNKKRLSALNTNANGKNANLLSAKTDTPYRSNDVVSENEVQFVTATPNADSFTRIRDSLSYITETGLPGTCFKSINSGVYAPIMLGSPGEPDPEFLYANPQVYDPQDSIFGSTSDQSNCEKVYMFANLQGNGQSSCQLPTAGKQTINVPNGSFKVEQNCGPEIKLSQICFNVQSCGSGVSILSGYVDIDTWYNGNFNKIGRESLGIGTEKWKELQTTKNFTKSLMEVIPERYTWQFGTIWYFKGFNNSSKNPRKPLRLGDYIDPYIHSGSLKPECDDSTCPKIEQVDTSKTTKTGYIPVLESCTDNLDISNIDYDLQVTKDTIIYGVGSSADTFLSDSLYRANPKIEITHSGCVINLKTYLYDVAAIGSEQLSSILSNNGVSVNGSICDTIDSVGLMRDLKAAGQFSTQVSVGNGAGPNTYYGKTKTYEFHGRPIFTFLFTCYQSGRCINVAGGGPIITISYSDCCESSSSSSSSHSSSSSSHSSSSSSHSSSSSKHSSSSSKHSSSSSNHSSSSSKPSSSSSKPSSSSSKPSSSQPPPSSSQPPPSSSYGSVAINSMTVIDVDIEI